MEKKIFNDIRRLPEFGRDIKKLRKRFRTLEEDLEVFIKTQLNLSHKLNIDNKGVFQIPGLNIDYPLVYKAKKFACRSLRGRGSDTGIRIVYAYFHKEDIIEFIEIYFKGDKENEDRKRILDYYSKDKND